MGSPRDQETTDYKPLGYPSQDIDYRALSYPRRSHKDKPVMITHRPLHLTHPGMVMLFMCVLHEMGVSRSYAEVETALKGIEEAAKER